MAATAAARAPARGALMVGAAGGGGRNAGEGGGSWVEEGAGVEDLVAIEEVGGPVKFVGARFGDGVYDGPGGAAVLRGVAAGEDGELVDGVYAEVDSGGASGGGVGVVVNDHSVDAVGVLIGAVAAIGGVV